MAQAQKNRLNQGGRIDRSKPLSFTFNGKKLQGYQVDTAADGREAVGALERTGQNQVQAAKLLGVTRDRLRYRMKKFGFLADPRG